MKWDEEQAHLQQWSHEQSKERDLPTKESPILAILLLIAISLSLSSLPRHMVSRDAKPDQKGFVNQS